MKQIITIIALVFLFFGCTPKQVVELKLPQKKDSTTQIKPKKEKAPVVVNESITVIEEHKPDDIRETKPDEIIDVTRSINDEKPIKEEPIESNNVSDVTLDDLKVDMKKVKIKIAFIYPSSLVEKYAKSSLDTVSGYLSYQ